MASTRAEGELLLGGQEPGQPAHNPQQPERSCGYHFKNVAYILPIAAAAREAAETALVLAQSPLYFTIPATACNFGASMSINSKYSVEGIENTYIILKNRALPEDWPVLSMPKNIVAGVTSALMSGYTAFCDGVLTYNFVKPIPMVYGFTSRVNMTGWKVGSYITAGLVFLNITTGEGMATFQKSRELLAGTKFEYSNKFSKYLSPTVGFTLGVIGSFNDAAMTCAGMYDFFEITSKGGKIGFGIASTANMITDYCMNGSFVVECLDNFFGAFTPAEGENPAYKDPKVITSLILSLAAGGLLAYTYQGITKDAFLELMEAVGIDLTEVTAGILEGITIAGAASFGINGTGSIFPIFYKGAEKIGSCFSYLYNACCGANEEDEDEDEEEAVEEAAEAARSENESESEPEAEPSVTVFTDAVNTIITFSDEGEAAAEVLPDDIFDQAEFQDALADFAAAADDLAIAIDALPQDNEASDLIPKAEAPKSSFPFGLFSHVPADRCPSDDEKDMAARSALSSSGENSNYSYESPSV